MKKQRIHWLLLPVILFVDLLFYLQVSLYSVFPYEQGAMSFWLELKNVWYRSLLFYVLVMLSVLFVTLQIKASCRN